MLRSIPEKYTIGLSAVVLTNQDAMNRTRKRRKTWSRGRKVQLSECLGIYHPARRGESAWIEIFVDQVQSHMPKAIGVLPFIREMVLGQTPFHELRHHIHFTQVPEHRQRENVADDWSDWLGRTSFRSVHPYSRWLLLPFLPLVQLVVWAMKSRVPRKERSPA